MTNRTIRLQQINSRLAPVVQFARPYDDGYDEDDHPHYGGLAAAGAGAAGAGYGGYKLHGAIRARQAGNFGMTYAGAARDVAATGVARTAGMIRGAGTSIASTAQGAGQTLEEQGRSLLNKGVERLRGAQAGAVATGQAIGKMGRQGMAAVGAGYKSASRSVSTEGMNLLKSLLGASIKKVGQAGYQAARHTYSIDERLIMLETPQRYEIRF